MDDFPILTATTTSIDRPFLTTPFEEYTVTEGFMLMFLVMLIIAVLYRFIRRFI